MKRKTDTYLIKDTAGIVYKVDADYGITFIDEYENPSLILYRNDKVVAQFLKYEFFITTNSEEEDE